MRKGYLFNTNAYYLTLSFLIIIAGCSSSGIIRPMNNLNGSIFQSSSSYREPNLGERWLVSLANHRGKDKIELFDLRTRRFIVLPGINRSDSQPISVSISANGERLAFIRQRADQTELLLYRRNVGRSQIIDITPKGIPRRVSLDGSGKILAVQVSREGRWDIDLIRLPGFSGI